METSEHAWHYTTAAGLIGMLTRHRLWATSAAYMNDRDEVSAGREALLNALKTQNPPLEEWQWDQLSGLGVTRTANAHNLFLLCASTKGDALTLWRSYGVGSEAEYSVDLDPSVALLPVQQDDAAAHPAPAPAGWYEEAVECDERGEPFNAYDPDDAYSYGGEWGVVQYLSDTSRAAAREAGEIVKLLQKPPPGKRTMPFVIDYLAGPDPTVRFKNPGFEDEAEVRNTWTVHPWWRFVLYRPSRFGIAPYIEVAASGSELEGKFRGETSSPRTTSEGSRFGQSESGQGEQPRLPRNRCEPSSMPMGMRMFRLDRA